MTTQPPRLPLRLVLACVLAALLLAGGGALALLLRHPSVFDGLLYLVSGAVVVAAYIGLLALYNRLARWEAVQHDKAIHLAHAQRALPAGVQSVAWHDSSRPALPPPAASEVIDVSPAAPPSVPTFAQLLDSGKIGPGQPLILGFRADDGQAITGSWLDLYSVGIGGLTGSGKSWLAAFLVAQSAAAGARLIVIDPHAGNPESLANRLAPLSASFMCDVASTPAQIASALKLAADKLGARAAGRGGQWPLLLVCDEWTSLLRGSVSDLLISTAQNVAEQGRKYGCFALLSAQVWQIAAAGPVRDQLASHYAMKTRGDQFRYQLGLRGSAPLDTLFLHPGQAYFLSNGGVLAKVQIPFMTDQDMARIGAQIASDMHIRGAKFGFAPATPLAITPTARVAEPKPERSQNVAAPAAATAALGTATGASPEAARAAALFVAGSSPAEIVREMRGVSSREGSRYQAALTEILDLIRQGYRGGQDGS